MNSYSSRSGAARASVWPLVGWALPGLIISAAAIVLETRGTSLSSESRVWLEKWLVFGPLTPFCALGFAVSWVRGARGAPWSYWVAALLVIPSLYVGWYWLALVLFFLGVGHRG